MVTIQAGDGVLTFDTGKVQFYRTVSSRRRLEIFFRDQMSSTIDFPTDKEFLQAVSSMDQLFDTRSLKRAASGE